MQLARLNRDGGLVYHWSLLGPIPFWFATCVPNLAHDAFEGVKCDTAVRPVVYALEQHRSSAVRTDGWPQLSV